MKEEVLKNISELLKKHEDYLNNNPEVFHMIEDRLFKAIDYENWQGEKPEDDEESYGEGYGDDLFDRPSEGEDKDFEPTDEGKDDADQWLQANDPVPEDVADINEAEAQTKAVEPAPPKRSSRYLDWKPKGEYSDEHNATMEEHRKAGYSDREAERMSGAHDAPTDFYSALKHTTNPSEPSPKMLEDMKSLSHEWLRNADLKTMAAAEADVNPIKHASGKSIAAHDEAHKDFADEYHQFMHSDEVKGLKGRERHKAIKEWKANYHEANPEHRENVIAAAESGKVLGSATEARKQRREEGTQALLEAGMAPGEIPSGYSAAVSEAEGVKGTQAAAQMVGGEKGEAGYTASIKRDPAAVFAERNPEYIKSLKGKLSEKLNPEQTQRMAGVDSFKKKGNE